MTDLKIFDFEDFFSFYESLSRTEKRHLRNKIVKFSRNSEQTVKNWISSKYVPLDKSDDVTRAVIQFSSIVNINAGTITEEVLFPNYADILETYK